MALARKQLVDVSVTQYYHCISRCVRRAFLCGKTDGKNYSHRRAWVLARLKVLTEIFSIKICAYAIMSNHYHLVLYVDTKTAKSWSDQEVIMRWKRLFKTAPDLANLQITVGDRLVEQWRRQLMDISWFMRCLNEYLAKRANLEDDCKGRFWEGRFKSQALLDEAALLTCMSYVDLNPVRAKMCTSLQESDFTSIQQRLHAYSKQKNYNRFKPKLMDFQTNGDQQGIPFDEKQYIKLVHWTGSVVRQDTKGFIPLSIKSTLNMCDVNEKQWMRSMKYFGKSYSWVIGRMAEIKARCVFMNKKWIRGMRASNIYFLNNVA